MKPGEVEPHAYRRSAFPVMNITGPIEATIRHAGSAVVGRFPVMNITGPIEAGK